jgi:tripartite-type tricarboxylate transporter receptor subunit TctC
VAPGLPALAQGTWPTRAVKLVSPYAAGGANDISARIFAEQLGQTFGQQFIVENKPGAGTRIANESVARATADGYTFLYAAAPYATAEALFGPQKYDRKDLVPVAMAAIAPIFVIVNAKTPVKTLKELIAYGKSRPDGLTFACPGVGSQPHLAAELLFMDAGVKGINVQYRGDAPAYMDLLAGRVDATFTAISTALPHVHRGDLRVLGVASPTRSAIYPEAPTVSEQGFPNVVAAGWYGFLAPAATPREIVDRMQAEINRTLANPQVKQKLLDTGLEPRPGSAADFAQFIESETGKWTEVIRKAGIKVE